MKPNHIQHLYWRVGFGISPNQLKLFSKKKKKEIVNQLFEDSKSMTTLEVDTTEIKTILSDGFKISPENRKKVQKLSRQKTIDLNRAWINRLAEGQTLLREKMTLFWANIFVCEDNNVVYIQQFNNTLRQHALGHFGDFVKAISKEAAMTKYLNTKQNRKQKPNENFARELMELFMLGEGQYSEKDIKESAKAFTGYSHNLKGEFVFKKRQHDETTKTFFGKSGNFSGDDIIDIILEQKQCAQFICEKIYRYFVNDTLNENHIDEMVEVFYQNYDITKLMSYVFMSDWFYQEENIGSKIKSPIEFLVGLKMIVPVEFENKKQLLYIQKQLGQILLNPPNVAGWKGGKNWIDSNTIALRLKLPSILLNDAYISKVKAGATNDEAYRKEAFKKKYGKYFKTKTNWDSFSKQFVDVDTKDLPFYVISGTLSHNTALYLNTLDKSSKREYCIQLMSLPEYQMC
ncbi:DUF1800 domain-containing protein [Algibacter mikhailovii]|uniref:DUF1800 domain-containing protein n=1 Tax=Algibacter mikhailovii TaxID=425498 RepID=A0A918R7L3_9FLAO|nr:DUF1800 domain-containing protein [Algibacter mikhailovii]GGZ88789.1 hypothetical protein GCM10007028_28590 [Algibacter mikhailovii]